MTARLQRAYLPFPGCGRRHTACLCSGPATFTAVRCPVDNTTVETTDGSHTPLATETSRGGMASLVSPTDGPEQRVDLARVLPFEGVGPGHLFGLGEPAMCGPHVPLSEVGQT